MACKTDNGPQYHAPLKWGEGEYHGQTTSHEHAIHQTRTEGLLERENFESERQAREC